MTAQIVNSAIHVAGWFVNKAAKNKANLSYIKLQNMLFLAQLNHWLASGKILMPSMFVCCENGFYEPNVKLALKGGTTLDNGVFRDEEIELLENVWQKYAKISDDDVLAQICGLGLWKNNYRADEEIIVNPLEYTAGRKTMYQHGKKETKGKVRLSQNGPVEVMPWKPRKINDKK